MYDWMLLLITSSKLQFQNIFNYCESQLKNFITKETLNEINNFSIKNKAVQLQQSCNLYFKYYGFNNNDLKTVLNNDTIINININQTNIENNNMNDDSNKSNIDIFNILNYVLCSILYILLVLYMSTVLIITVPFSSLKMFIYKSLYLSGAITFLITGIYQCIIWPVMDTQKIYFTIDSCIKKYNIGKKHYLNGDFDNEFCKFNNYNNVIKSSEISNNNGDINRSINNNNNINNIQLKKINPAKRILFKIFIKETIFNKKLKFDIYKISILSLLKCIFSIWGYSLKACMILCARWCLHEIFNYSIDGYGGERYFWKRQKTNIEKIKFQ
ncbi:hypothetical protein PIROE2DRAFT_8374 [Piromyces sp. E2]|nr:hypothetical protein PIROE2DRAFT_8374 [Piromyces sp. E2]|eukprot:OUM64762.1 hypothetical protein PIROE2DRAFT_8374 [Piromyces sp. E2]